MYPESNRNFESNRILGGVGAILTAIGSFIPFQGALGLVFIIGAILVLIAMKGLSEDLKEAIVFKNTLRGFVFGVTGVAIGIAVFVALVTGIFSGLILSRPIVEALSIVVALGASLVVFLFLIFSAIFYRRAFDLLAAKTGEKMFRASGLLLLLGAVLIIFFGLGFILMFVGWLLVAVGFFSLKVPYGETVPAEAYVAPIPQQNSVSDQVKYCSFCGAENLSEGTFCTRCGRKLS